MGELFVNTEQKNLSYNALVDERLRNLQRLARLNSHDLESLQRYIAALEQNVYGIKVLTKTPDKADIFRNFAAMASLSGIIFELKALFNVNSEDFLIDQTLSGPVATTFDSSFLFRNRLIQFSYSVSQEEILLPNLSMMSSDVHLYIHIHDGNRCNTACRRMFHIFIADNNIYSSPAEIELGESLANSSVVGRRQEISVNRGHPEESDGYRDVEIWEQEHLNDWRRIIEVALELAINWKGKLTTSRLRTAFRNQLRR